MAPRKSKRGESVESGKVVDGGVTQNLNRRVTRSSTAAASSPPVPASVPEKEPAKKKPRKSSKKEDKVKPEDKEVKAEEGDKKPENEEVKPEGDEVKAEDGEKKPENEEVKPEEEEVSEKNVSFKKTVIIEHCKQCSCFKTKANMVKNGLEKEVTGIKVLINPEKPRRGCFEVREEGGEAFFTLLDLKRPFQNLKDTNMDEVISDIVEKIK